MGFTELFLQRSILLKCQMGVRRVRLSLQSSSTLPANHHLTLHGRDNACPVEPHTRIRPEVQPTPATASDPVLVPFPSPKALSHAQYNLGNKSVVREPGVPRGEDTKRGETSRLGLRPHR